MIRLTFSLTILIFLLNAPVSSQDCTPYFPAEEGTIIEMRHFDRKGKPTGSTVQEILSAEVSGNSASWHVRNTIRDEDGEALMESEMSFECRDGVFYFDMNNYLNSGSMAALESMEFSIEGDMLEFPPEMKAGDMLKDGQVRMLVDQMPALNTTVSIINRKVEAIEEIQTEAGVFECYKISFDIETRTIMTLRSSGVEWIAKNIGVVRSESYNRNGKLTGYSELSRLEK